MTTIPRTTPSTPKAVPAYREPGYLRYTLGQSASVLGDQVWYVALSWAAVQLASPAVAGLVMTVSAVPRLILMLFGGVFVDRFGPKRLMIGSDLVRAAVSLTAAAIALAAPGIPLLVAVAVVFGVVSAVFMPAAGAMGPLLLRDEQLSSGTALRELSSRSAIILGAPLGGVLVAAGGLALAALVDAATFLLSAVSLWALRPREVTRDASSATGTVAALREGLSYLRGHRLLLTCMIVSLLANLGFVGPMNVGLALVSQRNHWDASGIGVMLAGFGAGAAISAVILLRFTPRFRLGPVVAAGFLVQGATIIGMAVVPALWMAGVITVITGLTSGFMGVLLATVMQANTGDAYRGRVSSVSTLINLGVTPLAMAVTGFAVGGLGLLHTFILCAALSFAAGILAVTARCLRQARLG
ncbi:MAG: MFS transporter [Stackebrandtia sp.]